MSETRGRDRQRELNKTGSRGQETQEAVLGAMNSQKDGGGLRRKKG